MPHTVQLCRLRFNFSAYGLNNQVVKKMYRQIYFLMLIVIVALTGCRANQSQQPLFGGSGFGLQQPGRSLFGSSGFGGIGGTGIGGTGIGGGLGLGGNGIGGLGGIGGSGFGANQAGWGGLAQNIGGLNAGFNQNGSAGSGGALGQIFSPDSSQFQLQQVASQASQMAGQVGNLNSRLSQFDSDNQNLHAQVAALQQRLQNANNYNDQLKTQLSDQMLQLQQAQIQVQQTSAQAQQQVAAARSSNQFNQANPGNGLNAGFQQDGPGSRNAGFQNQQVQGQLTSANGGGAGGIGSPPSRFTGATIRANNSLMQKLQTVQLPGYKAWMDGDVIRLEGPTDRLFVSGTYQLNQNDALTISNLANIIRQNFPRQVIGVEAHWDGTPIEPATTSHHQLTATQALAVFDLLVRSGLPHDQVFTMAMGSNRLRYPNGNAANRRIEIVIYPETF